MIRDSRTIQELARRFVQPRARATRCTASRPASTPPMRRPCPTPAGRRGAGRRHSPVPVPVTLHAGFIQGHLPFSHEPHAGAAGSDVAPSGPDGQMTATHEPVATTDEGVKEHWWRAARLWAVAL